MSIVDFGPANDLPELLLPHTQICLGDERNTHCYRHEWWVEQEIVDFLNAAYPHLHVVRQERWPVVGIADVVTRHEAFGVQFINVIEVKRVPAGQSAVNQLDGYMSHLRGVFARTEAAVVLTGTLAAFRFTNTVGPTWLSLWPMGLS